MGVDIAGNRLIHTAGSGHARVNLWLVASLNLTECFAFALDYGTTLTW